MKNQKSKSKLNLIKTTITKLDSKAQRSVVGRSYNESGIGSQGHDTITNEQ